MTAQPEISRQDTLKEILLSRLGKMNSDTNKFVELQEIEILDFTMHAFQISCNLGCKFVPQSIMKKSGDKVFVPKWFLNAEGKL